MREKSTRASWNAKRAGSLPARATSARKRVLTYLPSAKPPGQSQPSAVRNWSRPSRSRAACSASSTTSTRSMSESARSKPCASEPPSRSAWIDASPRSCSVTAAIARSWCGCIRILLGESGTLTALRHLGHAAGLRIDLEVAPVGLAPALEVLRGAEGGLLLQCIHERAARHLGRFGGAVLAGHRGDDRPHARGRARIRRTVREVAPERQLLRL